MNTGGPASERTLLDEFAGQALQGRAHRFDNPHERRDLLAQDCYDIAESMLAEKARREATGKDSLQVPDHSPDAGKMAELQAANRELVEALEKVLECIHETRGPSAFFAVTDARATLTKNKESK